MPRKTSDSEEKPTPIPQVTQPQPVVESRPNVITKAGSSPQLIQAKNVVATPAPTGTQSAPNSPKMSPATTVPMKRTAGTSQSFNLESRRFDVSGSTGTPPTNQQAIPQQVQPIRGSMASGEPKKIYPYNILKDEKTRPKDVDVTALEKYLSESDIQQVFKMSSDELNKMPAWKKNNLKKTVGLI